MTKTNSPSIISNEILDKEFLKTIENALAIGSWEFNIKLNTLKWSSVTKKIHEVEEHYVPKVESGINFYKEGTHRDRITKLFNEALSVGANFDDEFLIITAKGNEKWVRAIGHPKFENGECTFVRGIFQDITQKTLEAKATILNEKQFRSIFTYSLTGMAIISLQGNWLKVNNSVCNMLGYKESEFYKFGFRDVTHPEDTLIGKYEIELMLAGELDNLRIEKRYIHKKGQTIYCILSLTIVRDFKGVPLHFIANINDISEIKIAKNKIIRLLSVSSKQNEKLLNFAHIVSHNLRSHGGNLEMLLDLNKEDNPESVDNDYYPLIQKAVTNLNETIENLNEVSIYNSTKSDDLQPLNLLTYTQNAVENIKASIIENNANIEILIDKRITIQGIPAYLDSILINFLTNAIKYRKPNVNPIIKLKAKQNQNNVHLSISDNGLGIDLEKYKDKIFGMYNVFHQHQDSRGLGLFITKNQIEAINGKVDLKSTIGVGTTFNILFNYE